MAQYTVTTNAKQEALLTKITTRRNLEAKMQDPNAVDKTNAQILDKLAADKIKDEARPIVYAEQAQTISAIQQKLGDPDTDPLKITAALTALS